jgi:hypothetical protein
VVFSSGVHSDLGVTVRGVDFQVQWQKRGPKGTDEMVLDICVPRESVGAKCAVHRMHEKQTIGPILYRRHTRVIRLELMLK